MELCPAVPDTARQELLEFDPFSGFVGLLPHSLDQVLCWVKTGTDRWAKLSLRDTQARLERLRASLLLGGLQVWTARCRAMDIWWKTQASAKCVQAEAKARMEREAKRKCEAAAAKGAKEAIAEATREAAANIKLLRPIATRVRGDTPTVPLQPASATARTMSRMERELLSFLTPSPREGPSTDLTGFRVNIRPRDFGQLITDNAQQADLLEEAERQDSVHNARKWVTLPWY
jgi:hypothetical protein